MNEELKPLDFNTLQKVMVIHYNSDEWEEAYLLHIDNRKHTTLKYYVLFVEDGYSFARWVEHCRPYQEDGIKITPEYHIHPELEQKISDLIVKKLREVLGGIK